MNTTTGVAGSTVTVPVGSASSVVSVTTETAMTTAPDATKPSQLTDATAQSLELISASGVARTRAMEAMKRHQVKSHHDYI